MEWLVKTIGLPLAEMLIDKLTAAVYSVYLDQIIARAEKEGSLLSKKRAAIVKSISKAETNEDRKVLSIMLADLN